MEMKEAAEMLVGRHDFQSFTELTRTKAIDVVVVENRKSLPTAI